MQKNIFELFSLWVLKTPEKTALVYEDKCISYKNLYEDVLTLSFYLNNSGVTKGSHVAIFSNNTLEFATILLSLAQLGAVAIALPLTLKSNARLTALRKSDVEFVIGWFSVINQLNEDDNFTCKGFVSLAQKADNALFFDEIMHEKKEFKTDYGVEISSPFILTLTSGSTGKPKPIILTQETKILRSITGTKDFYGLTKDDTVLVSTPLYHSLAQRSLLLPLMIGATAVILPKFTPNGWIQSIVKEKVSFLFAVSTQLDLLLKEKHLNQYDFSSLKTIVSSSALLKNESKEKLIKLFNANIHECYGTSEIGVATSISLSCKTDKLGSVGKALPYVSIKLDNETNEILCKSATAFSGYYLQQKNTNESFTEDGYFKTGDIGFLDQDDYLYYKGRINDVIITGGINVYPQDIERVLNSLESVKETAVIGVEDEYFGEIILAVIVAKKDTIIKISELRKACLSNLTDYQQPQQYEVVKGLPKTALGKVMKNTLKDMLL
ncbi:MAG: long-chain fatty acid--CoA ligase [Bacteroidetes bacterium]|nr:MAG: long-chain fatty acid--CoA ligase [Bacteroidota bacterium]